MIPLESISPKDLAQILVEDMLKARKPRLDWSTKLLKITELVEKGYVFSAGHLTEELRNLHRIEQICIKNPENWVIGRPYAKIQSPKYLHIVTDFSLNKAVFRLETNLNNPDLCPQFNEHPQSQRLTSPRFPRTHDGKP